MNNNTLKFIEAYSVRLEQIDQQTMHLLREWRNQADIRKQMVNQNLITPAQHLAWFKQIEQAHNQQHFIIYYKQQAIGAINIATEEASLQQAQIAQVGLYITEPKYKNNMLAFAPSLAINDYAFQILNINQLKSKVRQSNQPAIKYNQQLGYQFNPLNDEFTEITLTADNYEQASKQLKNWLSRG
ncbi:GNAT family N-acetyltransferase [Catenovulum adriaticum]|uniref:GNAT family N-acetyltransferase n=1 Tax=Catenovulum adriaticum TaxID=2984846 RepID=A0ABY7ANB1_9ALTE|nr:GNAT family N-acetyltransferase [Catenovulum sp. TS8]WAJ71039.1 GNAT family N-acetyltransferase [Catenovulum sp. TS8]